MHAEKTETILKSDNHGLYGRARAETSCDTAGKRPYVRVYGCARFARHFFCAPFSPPLTEI